ncbi:MAG: UDP-N-acetylmuramoyl-L-alanyl-D-glutamate--2,6-diaminopimelate ligase [Actinobacteria bacterium]|nr:UDP-N-acetylmuramoyl-L-alanyl-D-glutamate--2,6-diaminopimelate ligase [Actinomycetota bacterium]
MINLKLADLLKEIPYKDVKGNTYLEVSGITSNSMKVEEGYVFVCIKGTNVDGHDFAMDAVKKGAIAVVCEREIDIPHNVAKIFVEDSREAYALLSAAIFKYPSKYMKVIGVTGTNGKTTTTHLIESIFRKAGFKTGLIGTVRNKIGDDVIPVTHTTPDSYELQSLFDAMRRENVEIVSMEVSSHAIDQKRIVGTNFSALVFTNLSQDHLDYHLTMEEYARVKMSLFINNPDVPWIVNLDDPVGEELYSIGKSKSSRLVTYGFGKNAEIRADDINVDIGSINFKLIFKDKPVAAVYLPLTGIFNVYNALAAASACHSLGISFEQIAAGLREAETPPGRFEMIKSDESFFVIVDYAHTPDGLKNVIDACLGILKGNGRLITVFGCGGDRDKDKRPKMGAIAASMSSLVIVTSDNPRSEEPEEIIDDILKGIEEDLKYKVIVEVDRKKAIFKAIEMARSGDIVLIAGKGHENYQIFKDRTVHFDDREVAKEAIEERKRKIAF